MKTKIVYVLTSTSNDIYLEQTLLSIHSLKKHNPDAYIVLLLDDGTANGLVGNRSTILNYVSEKIVVDFDASISNMRRSRHLKTSMRSLVEGDFLYIDGDTIINSSLEDIDSCTIELGAVDDAHRLLDSHYGKEKLLRQAKTLSFSIDGESHYFNGGVLYVKDSARTRKFFDMWHNYWKDSVAHGINQDMPALIRTNIEMNHMIEALDGSWNCQIMYGFNYFTSAKIIHYFASRYTSLNGGFIYSFMDPTLFAKIKETGCVDPSLELSLDRPLSCFSDTTELIGGIDTEILNTHVYKLVRHIFQKKPGLFKLMQGVLYKVNKYNKKRKE